MSHTPFPSARWATSSLGHAADVSSLERAALHAHLCHCGARRGPLPVLRAGADALQGLLAARAVTATVVMALLCGLTWQVL